MINQEYKITFNGRTSGAIGIFQNFAVTVIASNETKAVESLFKDFDHISRLTVNGKSRDLSELRLFTAAREVELTVNDFKSELTDGEIKEIRARIIRYFRGEILTAKGGGLYNPKTGQSADKIVSIRNENDLDENFGLPYTSHTVAMLSNTNGDIDFLPGFRINFFAQTVRGEIVMACANPEAVERFFVI